MSKYKKVATRCYRFDLQLVKMLDEVSELMERTEADAVRVMLYGSCKFWLKKLLLKREIQNTGYEEQSLPEDDMTDEEFKKLEEYVATLK
jgi:hypothetical protein